MYNSCEDELFNHASNKRRKNALPIVEHGKDLVVFSFVMKEDTCSVALELEVRGQHMYFTY